MKDLTLTMQDCGLERAGAFNVLKALGQFADRDTKASRASMETLALAARLDVKNVGRTLKRLMDEDHKALAADGLRHDLIVCIDAPQRGVSSAGVWRVHWERLELVADAVRIARRHVRAGAARALHDAKLAGLPASPEACSKVIRVLERTLRSEQRHGPAKEVAGLQIKLAEAMADWPQWLTGVEPSDPVDNRGSVGDVSSRSSDVSSSVGDVSSRTPCTPYKDTTPQGKSSGAGMRAGGAPSASVSGADDAGRFGGGNGGLPIASVAPQFLAAKIALSADQRGRVLEALVGAQIIEMDGQLTIRAAGPDHQARLLDLLADLLTDHCMAGGHWSNYSITARKSA